MNEVQEQTVKPISDDQELAKVLAGIGDDSDALAYEATPVAAVPPKPETPAPQAAPVFEMPPIGQIGVPAVSNEELEAIKKSALQELRPLVEKLDLAPEEKFDIYLLLLRSTDDTTLIAPAHTTAQQIEDESKRAQALLDIIKEIDFLSKPV